jgi:hypothetical protein
VYPNPTSEKLFVKMDNKNATAYYVKILNALGRTILMLPRPDLTQGIDIRQYAKGVYHLVLTDEEYKQTVSKTFVIE